MQVWVDLPVIPLCDSSFCKSTLLLVSDTVDGL